MLIYNIFTLFVCDHYTVKSYHILYIYSILLIYFINRFLMIKINDKHFKISFLIYGIIMNINY
jgi:hypothetical protein